MAGDTAKPCELDQEKYDAEDSVKIICLGDSAVGKSNTPALAQWCVLRKLLQRPCQMTNIRTSQWWRLLMERFLMDGFQPQQLSTYALTLYKHTATVDGRMVLVETCVEMHGVSALQRPSGGQSCVHVADFWDTAGQERFQSMHASYYHKAHACIMVFDVQRKVTYRNLGTCGHKDDPKKLQLCQEVLPAPVLCLSCRRHQCREALQRCNSIGCVLQTEFPGLHG
ncbi:rab-like protein 2B isoform X6 [Desmodus rotundus]|uniref:rab-like protein 2B isoform X6 n=1 Tax=Desmodus rotundus TaxID=9430 RepID=UPI00238140ED|nr:rab-like protein 2B isoform X6 [Desmodus rotundus]